MKKKSKKSMLFSGMLAFCALLTIGILASSFGGRFFLTTAADKPSESGKQSNEPTEINDSVSKDSDNPALVLLNAEQIDTSSPVGKAKRAAVQSFEGKRMHLVKFGGPIQNDWYESLVKSGAQVVTYIPNYCYLVYGDSQSLQRIQENARNTASNITWDAPYLDNYKISPDVYNDKKSSAEKGSKMRSEYFSVQLVKDEAANKATLGTAERLKTKDIRQQYEIMNYVNFVVGLDEQGMLELASHPEVVSIQPYIEPKKNDERQDIILTGNLTGNAPTPGDYLAYLTGKGFTQSQFDASNFLVNVSDSGIDAGNTSGTVNPTTHFGLYRSGDLNSTSRVVYSRLVGTANAGSTTVGCDGHGNLNSHIVAGYVPNTAPFNAAPHVDANGFRYGLGVAPYVKVGSSVIFDPNTFTSPNYLNLEAQAYQNGSRISSNSWGANVSGAYNTDSQSYDSLVRDAQQATSTVPVAGNQEYTILFSAGNNGSGVRTIGSPGTGKNVITVGAAENVQAFGAADQCGVTDAQADSANDIIGFSSRGPTVDGRAKPDIQAPGTHITGGVSQAALVNPVAGNGAAVTCFAASGVCGGGPAPAGNFFPTTGQQWYTASSGTSHSCPAVAGVAALIRQHFINQSLTPPSPAMTKGIMMNSARYMTGVGANDSLFSNNQGMGMISLNNYFDIFARARILRDEVPTDLFTASGQVRTVTGNVVDNTKPFRVTLAYTDVPGPTTGNSYVNNLDLEVTVGGQTYLGNVFSGANSASGGTADVRNNAESVFLPAGVTGPFVVRVRATNIAGDGVPGNASALDQDYALVVSNASEAALPVLDGNVVYVSDNGTPANGTPDPGEMVTVNLNLNNVGTANSGNVTATLMNSGGISNPSAPQGYGALATGAAAVSRPFTFKVPSGATCGSAITLSFQVQEGSSTTTITKQYTLGTLQISFSQNFDSVTAPALPTGWTNTAETGTSAWVTAIASPSSAPNSLFAPDPAVITLTNIETPSINIGSSSAQMTFDMNFTFEGTTTFFDGAVLEMKIGSGAYQDILAAGGTFVTGGYRGPLSTSFSNPLGGRQAWGGASGGYIPVVINLPAAANGQSTQFRWRMGSDSSVSAAGVNIDNIRINGNYACSAVSTSSPRSDFDGDGKSDLSIFRPSEGNWYLNRSTAGLLAYNFGISTDTMIVGDIDGDGKADSCIFRPTLPEFQPDFFALRSSNFTVDIQSWGVPGDIPQMEDFDGDGKDDYVVWRPTTGDWYVYQSTAGFKHFRFGLTGDKPVRGDFDGDGKADFAVFRPSNGVWYINLSSNNSYVFTSFGLANDVLVPADYDGDGKTDIAVWRPTDGVWYIARSTGGISYIPFGLSTDTVVPGDYDGDGKYDPAVYRAGTWYVAKSTGGVMISSFGTATDRPTEKMYIP